MINENKKAPSFKVEGFILELGLTRCERDVYAVIYSFSKDNRGTYYGTQKKLAVIIGYSERSVRSSIKKLLERGLIEKVDTAFGKMGFKTVNINAEKSLTITKNQEISNVNKKENSQKPTGMVEQVATAEKVAPLAMVELVATAASADTAASAEKVAPLAMVESVAMAALDVQKKHIPCTEFNDEINLDDENTQKEPRESSTQVTKHNETCAFRERKGWERVKKTQKQTVEIETISLGRRGYITMSRAQFEKISRLVETDVLLAYFERFESMLENNMKMGMPAPHSHYKTIRKWIESDLL